MVTKKASKSEVGLEPVKQLSAAVLHSLFDGEQAERDNKAVATAEKTRMDTLRTLIPNTSDTEIKAACKAYVDEWKKKVNFQKGDDRKAYPKLQYAENRASDVTLLAGAVKHAGYSLEGKGLHTAVTEARVLLKAKGLKKDGSPLPTKEEKEKKALVSTLKGKQAAVNDAAVKFALEHGREPDRGEMQALQDQADALHAHKSALDIAREIVASHSVEKAEQVAALIPQAIQEWEAIQEKLTDPARTEAITVANVKKMMAEAEQSIKH